MDAIEHNQFTDFRRGDPVTVIWHGGPRYGAVVAAPYGSTLPTGQTFVPIVFDDDSDEITHNVDSRGVYWGTH